MYSKTARTVMSVTKSTALLAILRGYSEGGWGEGSHVFTGTNKKIGLIPKHISRFLMQKLELGMCPTNIFGSVLGITLLPSRGRGKGPSIEHQLIGLDTTLDGARFPWRLIFRP